MISVIARPMRRVQNGYVSSGTSGHARPLRELKNCSVSRENVPARAREWTRVPYSSFPRNEGVRGSSPRVGSSKRPAKRDLTAVRSGSSGEGATHRATRPVSVGRRTRRARAQKTLLLPRGWGCAFIGANPAARYRWRFSCVQHPVRIDLRRPRQHSQLCTSASFSSIARARLIRSATPSRLSLIHISEPTRPY